MDITDGTFDTGNNTKNITFTDATESVSVKFGDYEVEVYINNAGRMVVESWADDPIYP